MRHAASGVHAAVDSAASDAEPLDRPSLFVESATHSDYLQSAAWRRAHSQLAVETKRPDAVTLDRQRAQFLDRVYSDYAELKAINDDIYQRKLNLIGDDIHSNHSAIRDLLFGDVTRQTDKLGDWDTYHKVDKTLQKFVFSRATLAAEQDAQLLQRLEKSLSDATTTIEQQRMRMEELEQSLSAAVSRLRNVERGMANAQTLAKEKDRQLTLMKAQVVVLESQLAHQDPGVQRTPRGHAENSAEKSSPKHSDHNNLPQQQQQQQSKSRKEKALMNIMGFIKAGKELESENQVLKAKLIARQVQQEVTSSNGSGESEAEKATAAEPPAAAHGDMESGPLLCDAESAPPPPVDQQVETPSVECDAEDTLEEHRPTIRALLEPEARLAERADGSKLAGTSAAEVRKLAELQKYLKTNLPIVLGMAVRQRHVGRLIRQMECEVGSALAALDADANKMAHLLSHRAEKKQCVDNTLGPRPDRASSHFASLTSDPAGASPPLHRSWASLASFGEDGGDDEGATPPKVTKGNREEPGAPPGPEDPDPATDKCARTPDLELDRPDTCSPIVPNAPTSALATPSLSSQSSPSKLPTAAASMELSPAKSTSWHHLREVVGKEVALSRVAVLRKEAEHVDRLRHEILQYKQQIAQLTQTVELLQCGTCASHGNTIRAASGEVSVACESLLSHSQQVASGDSSRSTSEVRSQLLPHRSQGDAALAADGLPPTAYPDPIGSHLHDTMKPNSESTPWATGRSGNSDRRSVKKEVHWKDAELPDLEPAQREARALREDFNSLREFVSESLESALERLKLDAALLGDFFTSGQDFPQTGQTVSHAKKRKVSPKSRQKSIVSEVCSGPPLEIVGQVYTRSVTPKELTNVLEEVHKKRILERVHERFGFQLEDLLKHSRYPDAASATATQHAGGAKRESPSEPEPRTKPLTDDQWVTAQLESVINEYLKNFSKQMVVKSITGEMEAEELGIPSPAPVSDSPLAIKGRGNGAAKASGSGRALARGRGATFPRKPLQLGGVHPPARIAPAHASLETACHMLEPPATHDVKPGTATTELRMSISGPHPPLPSPPTQHQEPKEVQRWPVAGAQSSMVAESPPAPVTYMYNSSGRSSRSTRGGAEARTDRAAALASVFNENVNIGTWMDSDAHRAALYLTGDSYVTPATRRDVRSTSTSLLRRSIDRAMLPPTKEELEKMDFLFDLRIAPLLRVITGLRGRDHPWSTAPTSSALPQHQADGSSSILLADPIQKAVKQIREEEHRRKAREMELIFRRVAARVRVRRFLKRSIHAGPAFVSYVSMLWDQWTAKVRREQRLLAQERRLNRERLLQVFGLAVVSHAPLPDPRLLQSDTKEEGSTRTKMPRTSQKVAGRRKHQADPFTLTSQPFLHVVSLSLANERAAHPRRR